MRSGIAAAAAALLAACSAATPATNCTMTLTGEGADPSLRCVASASPTEVQVSENGGPYRDCWGLVVHGYRDDAQEDQAVAVLLVFDPGVEPAAGTTYACTQGSDPTIPWRVSVLRGSSPSVLTHSMHSPDGTYGGTGSFSVAFTSVMSTSSMDAPTHGALDATLVAVDGSGKTLDLHVDL